MYKPTNVTYLIFWGLKSVSGQATIALNLHLNVFLFIVFIAELSSTTTTKTSWMLNLLIQNQETKNNEGNVYINYRIQIFIVVTKKICPIITPILTKNASEK